MKKYQIVTYDKYGGYDEKLDFDTIKQAKENINLYTDYDYIYIIDTKTHQVIYSEHNKKQSKTEKTNRQKVLEFIIQDNMKTKDEVIDFCETNDIDYIFFENTVEKNNQLQDLKYLLDEMLENGELTQTQYNIACENADYIIEKYDDYGTDWQTAMEAAIYFVTEEEE